MTTDEIKQSVSMRDVIEGYGLTINRAGFCKCPFHSSGSERTASLKVYDTSFNCFGCGANGDIFTFVQRFENLSFKEAYLKLGGEYRFTSDRDKKRILAKSQREKSKRERAKTDEQQFKNSLIAAITLVQSNTYEPFSDEWCELKNAEPKLLYWWELLLDGREIDRIDVSRAIRKLNKRLNIG